MAIVVVIVIATPRRMARIGLLDMNMDSTVTIRRRGIAAHAASSSMRQTAGRSHCRIHMHHVVRILLHGRILILTLMLMLHG
jgi:hypothetical protein